MDTLTLVSDADLARMIDRAYREAARSWSEWRKAPRGTAVARMLLEAANTADGFYGALVAERDARETAVRS